MSAALADGVLAVVRAATEPLINEIKSLRAQIARLEAQKAAPLSDIERRLAALDAAAAPTLRYVGVWRDGTAYPPQTAVTRSGSIWITVTGAPAGAMPGLHGDDDERGPWQLAVKRGKDGRDGRDAR